MRVLRLIYRDSRIFFEGPRDRVEPVHPRPVFAAGVAPDIAAVRQVDAARAGHQVPRCGRDRDCQNGARDLSLS